MEKYVDCHNCQNQYDCERTYLGGCTDGKEWENETEKAFVDGWEQRREELKAERQAILEFEKDICKNASPCALVDWVDCDKKADCGKVRNQAKVLYRLGYRKLSEGSVIITKEQKAEIERLTEEKWQAQDDLDNYHAMYQEEVKANAELQKRVDELTQRLLIAKAQGLTEGYIDGVQAERNAQILKPTIIELPKEITKKIKEQAVKDTAKEILAKAPTETDADEMFIHWLRERYGVEVE